MAQNKGSSLGRGVRPLVTGFIFMTLASGSAADVSGRISLKGTPPPEKTIVMDELCSRLHVEPVTTRHFVVSSNGGLANVFVYISKGLEGRSFPVPTEAVELDQKGGMYEPYVSGLMTGQTLRVKNSDDLLHNVHCLPKIPGNREFNFAQPFQGQVTEKTFTKREIMVKFKCDVHNWMFAYVGVVEHPFFAVTDKDGQFALTNVPPGTYTLTAYHQKMHGTSPGLSQSITVDSNSPAIANFVMEAGVAPPVAGK